MVSSLPFSEGGKSFFFYQVQVLSLWLLCGRELKKQKLCFLCLSAKIIPLFGTMKKSWKHNIVVSFFFLFKKQGEGLLQTCQNYFLPFLFTFLWQNNSFYSQFVFRISEGISFSWLETAKYQWEILTTKYCFRGSQTF